MVSRWPGCGVRRTDAAVIGLFQTLAQAARLSTFSSLCVGGRALGMVARARTRTQIRNTALSVFALYHGHEGIFSRFMCVAVRACGPSICRKKGDLADGGAETTPAPSLRGPGQVGGVSH